MKGPATPGGAEASSVEIVKVLQESDTPRWTNRSAIATFVHEDMKPYEDTLEDIQRGLDYAFSTEENRGGFMLLGRIEERLVGVLVMLHTGMKGFVPENQLLFVCVHHEMRGHGLGRRLIERAISECRGNVKLHVEYDNPAKRLYERLGFTSEYAEMRYEK